MTTDDNKRLLRRYIEEVINTGNVDNIDEFISPEYVEVHHNTRHFRGIEGAKHHVLGVRETYPDLKIAINHQIAEGDWVVTRITAHGTHLGEWMGMKPTGKPIEITGINIDKILDGRIVEHGGAANLLQPMLEAGAVQVANPVEE